MPRTTALALTTTAFKSATKKSITKRSPKPAILSPANPTATFTPSTLRSASKQSAAINLIPVALRRAIKKYLRERSLTNMKRKVLHLSHQFTRMKDANVQLIATTSRAIVENTSPLPRRTGRWKIKSLYGDIGLKYQEDQTVAYVASRMPSVYSAIFRVLKEVRNRIPGFAPGRVLDFGAGPGTALWAMREVWPRSIQSVNLVEPSKSMQRAAQSLLEDLKGLPLIHSYDSLQLLNQKVKKEGRKHDIVICSYALGEIPSLSERITVVRQLWDLTQDVLVLLEPGTPHGSNIIGQMRSYILWMAKRKRRKSGDSSSQFSSKSKGLVLSDEKSISTHVRQNGAYVVAPCPHDGRCPLLNTGKYCHFVQRLQRTTSQRAYKRSRGVPLRGFEDEKFSFVALRRGNRPSKEAWPLDGMEFETLKERHAKRDPEDLIIDYSDQFETSNGESDIDEEDDFDEDTRPASDSTDIVPFHGVDEDTRYASDSTEIFPFHGEENDNDEEEKEDEQPRADLGSGWGRIVFSPVRRGKLVEMNVCRSSNREGTEGTFDRVVVTKSKNPTLHLQARKSLWGDLWPDRSS